MTEKLFRPLGREAVHLCIDMQRLFASDGVWPTPWMERVLPVVTELAAAHRTLYTRFIPAETPDAAPGMWRRYYEAWPQVTLRQLDPRQLDLMPPLLELAPPPDVLDKPTYSAFGAPALLPRLRDLGAEAVVLTGTETDVCVLSTALDAVDLGLRVVIVRDAVCSSSDEGHDALIRLFETRFSHQVEIADSTTLALIWRSI